MAGFLPKVGCLLDERAGRETQLFWGAIKRGAGGETTASERVTAVIDASA